MRQPVEVHERRAWPCSVVQRRASSTSQRARRQGKPDSRQGFGPHLMPTASLPLPLLLFLVFSLALSYVYPLAFAPYTYTLTYCWPSCTMESPPLLPAAIRR